MSDDIHKTHFQVPELPWKEKEKQAILLFQQTLKIFYGLNSRSWSDIYKIFINLFHDNKDLIDWIMKYNE